MMPLKRQRGTCNRTAVGEASLGVAAKRWSARCTGETHVAEVAEVVVVTYCEDKGDTPMMRRRKHTRNVVLLGWLLVGVLVGTSLATALEVGEQAPDFTLSSTTGETIALNQYREKQWVLLEFYIGGGIPAEHPT
jgi:hypothetical protein